MMSFTDHQYGKQAWEDVWAKKNGDDTYEWGPDPLLTLLGMKQAQHVHDTWTSFLQLPASLHPPLPELVCSSPLRRSLSTLCISWQGILAHETKVHIREHLREVIGKNTCDQRVTRTDLERHMQLHPFRIAIHGDFTEHDSLWTVREQC